MEIAHGEGARVEELVGSSALGERLEEMVQTHLSTVLLGARRVWKLKKPLDLGFADFRTLARRRFFCEEEARLNRRLSTIYEGVDEVRRAPAGDRIGAAEGEVVDYAVRMRRLPADARALAMLERGELRPEHLARLAERIAAFHEKAESSARTAPFGDPALLRRNATDNFAACAASCLDLFPAETLERVRRWSDAFLAEREGLFRARVESGRVRDVHGDLHLDHVYFAPDLEVIDCIDFNEAFRCGDVAGEIAFLAMDLDYRGRADLAGHWLSRYLELAQDYEALGVLPFYLCYRAMVRAKVAGIVAEEREIAAEQRAGARASAARHLALADRYAGGTAAHPFLAVMTGLVGSGKSHVAQAISERTGAIVVSTDRVRKRLLGLAPTADAAAVVGASAYGEDVNARVYARLLEAARWAAEAGRPAILDGVFPLAEQRGRVRALAEALGVKFLIVETTAPHDVLLERLQRRKALGGSISDAGPDLLAPLRKHYEEPTAEEGACARVPSGAEAEGAIEAVARLLA